MIQRERTKGGRSINSDGTRSVHGNGNQGTVNIHEYSGEDGRNNNKLASLGGLWGCSGYI